jgi:pyruvate/2-oxoglutarate dehydrogenase complex dihydrolipoamide dehydrogenase (E3) component
MARRAAEFGVLTGPVEIDLKVAMARMTNRVNESRKGLEKWLASIPKLELVRGFGRLTGRNDGKFLVDVGGLEVSAHRVFLNTGTRPFIPPIPGLSDVRYLISDDLLTLDTVPRHLVIVGGGYISLELGQIFRRFGSAVTIIEVGPRLIPREDADVSMSIVEVLREEGIELLVGASIVKVTQDLTFGATGASVTLSNGNVVSGSHLLIAAGRIPNTDRLGLDAIGLATDSRGYVLTNERLETAISNVWALGDINRRGAFTHTSYHDHEIVLANLRGGARSADERTMAYAMFTDPPLGHVGLYEDEARRLVAKGRKISQSVFKMANVSRAKEEGEVHGLIKLLVDEEGDRFLGASIVGINADEIVQTIGQLMATNSSWRNVRDALPIHPTVTEFFPTILDKRRPLGPL